MTNNAPGHEATTGLVMARIARGGTASLAGAGVSAASSFLVVILVTRLYDAATAGALFAAISAFLILLATVELGVDQGFVRFIAWLRARREYDRIPTLLRLGYLPAIGAATAAAVACLALAAPVASLVSGDGEPHQSATLLRILGCALPVAAIYELTLAATRGYGTMWPTVVVERLLRPLAQPAAIVAAAGLGTGTVGLAVAWALPYALGLGAALAALARVRRRDDGPLLARSPSAGGSSPPEAPAVDGGPGSSSGSGRDFWRFTSAWGLTRVCQVALQRFDVILVAALRGPRDAAIYTAVTRFLVAGQLAMQAVQQVIQPKLAELLSIGNLPVAASVFRQATAWFVAMTWPLYLGIAVHSALLVRVFGADYSAGATSLVVLCLAMLVATATGPVDVMLVMSGRSVLSLVNTTAALVLDVVLCLVLVPDHGVLGAAVAWAAAILARNALGAAQVRAHLVVTSASPALGRVAAAAAVLLGLVPWLALLVAGPAASLAVLPAVLAGYLAVLWQWRDILGLAAFATVLRRRAPVPAAGTPERSR